MTSKINVRNLKIETVEALKKEAPLSCTCDDGETTFHGNYGWICSSCATKYEQIERDTDWDTWEHERRQRIAEANEY